MKKILILAVALMGLSFGQLAFNDGSISGFIRFTGTNTTTTLGQIPPGAMITGIVFGQEARFTNTTCTNSLQIGLSNITGNVMVTTQIPQFGSNIMPTWLSNGYVVLNRKAATTLNGYMTTTGPAFGTNGVLRIIINYLQVPTDR